MEDRTPRPYASSDEDFEMVPDANGTSDATNGAKDTLTLTAAAELSHVAPASGPITYFIMSAKSTNAYLPPMTANDAASCTRFDIESALGHANETPNRKLKFKLKSLNRPENASPMTFVSS